MEVASLNGWSMVMLQKMVTNVVRKVMSEGQRWSV